MLVSDVTHGSGWNGGIDESCGSKRCHHPDIDYTAAVADSVAVGAAAFVAEDIAAVDSFQLGQHLTHWGWTVDTELVAAPAPLPKWEPIVENICCDCSVCSVDCTLRRWS